MKFPIKGLAKARGARMNSSNAGGTPTVESPQAETTPPTLGAYGEGHPEMERRMKARSVWEFLDESRSTFYDRMNPKKDSFDPLFPRAIRSSTKGVGPKRWKLGAIIAWLRTCEANANSIS